MKKIALLILLLVASAMFAQNPATLGNVGVLVDQVFSAPGGTSLPVSISSGPFAGMGNFLLEFTPLTGANFTSCYVYADSALIGSNGQAAWTSGGAVSQQICTSAAFATNGSVTANQVRVSIAIQGIGSVRVRLIGALALDFGGGNTLPPVGSNGQFLYVASGAAAWDAALSDTSGSGLVYTGSLGFTTPTLTVLGTSGSAGQVGLQAGTRIAPASLSASWLGPATLTTAYNLLMPNTPGQAGPLIVQAINGNGDYPTVVGSLSNSSATLLATAASSLGTATSGTMVTADGSGDVQGTTTALSSLVVTTGTNTGGASMTLNMSASTSVSALVVPNISTCNETTNGAICYSSSSHFLTFGNGSATDYIAFNTNNQTATNIPKWSSSTVPSLTNSSVSDNGTTVLVSGEALSVNADFIVNSSGAVTTLGANTLVNTGVAGELFATDSGTQTATFGPTTMVATTPATTTWYRATFYVEQTAVGVGCTGNTTLALDVGFTGPNQSSSTNFPVGTCAIITTGAAGKPANCAGSTLGQASGSYVFPAKASTSVTYTVVYTAGSGCTTNPTFHVTPLLEQL